MTTALPRRNEVPQDYTWDLESIFASEADWMAAYERIEAALPELARHEGRIGESGATLLAWLRDLERVLPEVRRVFAYASMRRDEDTGNQQAAATYDRARGLFARLSATIAFGDPEILALGWERLRQLMAEQPALQLYEHHFDRLYRLRDHVRSAEVETLLGQVSDVLRTAAVAHSTLTDADLQFGSVNGEGGESIEVAQGTLGRILNQPERSLRRAAWERYADAHLEFKNTLAACISGGVKANVFNARARGYGSALEAATSQTYVPTQVFHNVLETYRKNLPTWHRYWAVRRKALGLDDLHTYDLWAPLSRKNQRIPFQQAVDWICEGMQPLGDEYISVMRRGLLEERWVDLYPNQGKRAGAYSSGGPGMHPFILMSYNDNLLSVSTLAHELGHSMHSYLSWRTQPFVYGRYTIFQAEVASNFNQALVRAHLLRTHEHDPEFQIEVIEEAMANFLRYFFIMPNLARFEAEIHARVERGEALTADSMSRLMAELYREGYGDEVVLDEARDGITWAEFSTHMYSNFYVYQYATGIAAANALADKILQNEPGAVDNYLQFLRAGSSLYPLDSIQLAGVDLASPEAIERAFGVMAGYIDRLEQLVDARA